MMNGKMSGKGKSKGKGLKLDAETLKKMTNSQEGALDFGFFIEAKMEYIGRWFKSRILGCRLAKDYDASKMKDESCYEYYVHYEPLNRRNDEWISFNRIKRLDERIIEEDPKKKIKKTEEKKDDKYTQHEGMDHASVLMHQEATKFKTVHRIQMGSYKAEAWYYSPYPAYYHNIDCLYVCEFCLTFFCLERELKRHSLKCPLFHPPGDEVYRDEVNGIAMFEVDGSKNPVYCQNLGFLSKLFLDHKNLDWDMSAFHFYVLCQIVNAEYHLTGYFSKPKQSEKNYNLSCILVLPFHQRKGLGKFLISFSYQLSLIEGRAGTPEKPLSDLGRETYLAWWSQRIIDYIREHKNSKFKMEDICRETGIMEEDIQWAMEQVGMLKINNGVPFLCVDESFLVPIYKKGGQLGKPVKKELIHWIAFRLKWDGQIS